MLSEKENVRIKKEWENGQIKGREKGLYEQNYIYINILVIPIDPITRNIVIVPF